jgi:hypothetical protein
MGDYRPWSSGSSRYYNRAKSPASEESSGLDHYLFVFNYCEESKVPLEKLFQPIIEADRSFVIVYHDPAAAPDIPTEYPCPHYHGLIRSIGRDITNERPWQRVKSNVRTMGSYFKTQKVGFLPSVCAYLRMPPKKVVINHLKGDTKDAWEAVTDRDIEIQIEKKKTKFQKQKEDKDDIDKMRMWMLECGTFSEGEMLRRFHSDSDFMEIYKKRSFQLAFDKAKQLASLRIMDMSLAALLKMAETRLWDPEVYLDRNDSWNWIERIAKHNNWDIDKFVQDVVDLLDMNRKKVNTLWLHGASNAGKSLIARSLAQLAVLYHQVPPGSNRFMFQNCCGMRLIILNEPILDESSIEAMKEIMEGTGCYVPVKQKNDAYLKGTPLIITSNTYLWALNQQAKTALLARCFQGYTEMSNFSQLRECDRELNPLWLTVGIAHLNRSKKRLLCDEIPPNWEASSAEAQPPSPKRQHTTPMTEAEKEKAIDDTDRRTREEWELVSEYLDDVARARKN